MEAVFTKARWLTASAELTCSAPRRWGPLDIAWDTNLLIDFDFDFDFGAGLWRREGMPESPQEYNHLRSARAASHG